MNVTGYLHVMTEDDVCNSFGYTVTVSAVNRLGDPSEMSDFITIDMWKHRSLCSRTAEGKCTIWNNNNYWFIFFT